MATKAPLGSLYAEGPEEQALVDEIKGSYAKLREALDSRQGRLFDPTLLAISQALGSPTKTGSFGEVLGNVAGAIIPVQQAEEKRAQEMANMKMELAQRELAQRQSARGEAMFREMLPRAGGQPQAPGAARGEPAATGAPAAPGAPAPQGRPITSEDVARLASIPGMGDKAKILGDLIKSNRERYHVSNDMIVDKDAPGGPKIVADLRATEQKPSEIVVGGKPLNVMMTGSELRDFNAAFAQGQGDKFYEKILKGRRTDVNLPSRGGALREIYVPLLGEVRFQGTDRQAAIIEKLQEEAATSGNTTELQKYVTSIRQAPPAPAAPAARPSASAAPEAPGRPPAVAGRQPPAAQPPAQTEQGSDLSSLPLAEQNKLIAERVSGADKPANETMATLMKSSGPESTISSNRRLKELVDITNKHPNVVGLMNQQGTLAALLAASQEGIRAGSVQVSLPVTTFLEKQKLSPQDQQIARRVAQLLDEEFFTRAAIAKSALGPQISNTDAVAMKSPMARPEDGAALIRYWSLHGVVVNKQNDEIVSSYNAWMDRTKGKQPTRQFWNTEGRKILNQYTPYFERLQQDFYPNMPR